MEARVPESYRIEARGHVDASEVLAGEAVGIDKFGNDAADELAVAAASHNKAGLEHGLRREATLAFVVRLHRMLVEIAKERSRTAWQPTHAERQSNSGGSSRSRSSSRSGTASDAASSSAISVAE